MKKYTELVKECEDLVEELFPWDLEERLQQSSPPLLLDVREQNEFEVAHIANSINVPRGILETSCEWNFDETIPELVKARDREVVVICRSGNRSLLAARTMQLMGYQQVKSLKTGLRGWNDYEQPLVDITGKSVDEEAADTFFTSRVKEGQKDPLTRG